MRPSFIALLAAIALFAGTAAGLAQQTKNDATTQSPATGEAKRPEAPKQIEPESHSHDSKKLETEPPAKDRNAENEKTKQK